MHKPGMGFSHEESREAWFYPSTAALLQQAQWCDFDPLSRQSDALGKPLAQVVAGLREATFTAEDLEHCNGNMLGVLDGASLVLITQCGSAGDPGTASSRWVVKLAGESVNRLLSSSTDTQSLPPSQLCWLGHTRPTISLRGVMSQLTGLDNSQLLPPYAPIMRNEDALFASMTTYLHPHSAVLNCDWAVPHLPVDERPGSAYDRPFAPGVSLATLASYLRGKIDTRHSASVEFRLATLAAEIRGLGECPPDVLLARAEVELVGDCVAMLNTLDARRAQTQELHHPGWQAFLKNFTAQAQAALLAPSTFEPGQQPGWMSPVQEAAIAFAEALEAWQAIRTCSASITAQLLSSDTLLP